MVFISSIAGMHPWTRAHYGAAEAAEIHLAASLAREFGPHGIRVNALSLGSVTYPGSVWEARREADEEAFAEWLRSGFPLRRLERTPRWRASSAFSCPTEPLLDQRREHRGGWRPEPSEHGVESAAARTLAGLLAVGRPL